MYNPYQCYQCYSDKFKRISIISTIKTQKNLTFRNFCNKILFKLLNFSLLKLQDLKQSAGYHYRFLNPKLEFYLNPNRPFKDEFMVNILAFGDAPKSR